MKLAIFFLALPALSFTCQQTPLENLRETDGLETLIKLNDEGRVRMYMFNHVIAHDDLEVLKVFLTTWGKVEYKDFRLTQAERRDAEPIWFNFLHLAAQFESLEIATFCLENGANINSQTSSRVPESHENTPAHIAVICGKHEALKMLLNRGGYNWNSKNGVGKTIEDIAREKNDQVALAIINEAKTNKLS